MTDASPKPRGRPRKEATIGSNESVEGEENMVEVGGNGFHLIIRELKKFPQVQVENAMEASEFDAYVVSWIDKGFKVHNSFILQSNEEFVTVAVILVKQ